MRSAFVVLLALTAGAAFAQIPFAGGGGPDANGVFQGMATFPRPSYTPPVVTGAPYSGQYMSDQVQTLADGTHITHSLTGDTVWRDSQGRTRVEHQMMQPNSGPAPTLIQITDPVSGYQYVMDTVNRVAHRVPLTAPQASPQVTRQSTMAVAAPVARPAVVSNPDAHRPHSSSESQGSRMIEGVMAQGMRFTTVFPVGTQDNDGPITTFSEQWTAPDLKITLLSVSSDPRWGVNTSRIANLSRAEPDAALFLVPPDYSVVDEPGEYFHITWGKQ